jgi:hypothetical protein
MIDRYLTNLSGRSKRSESTSDIADCEHELRPLASPQAEAGRPIRPRTIWPLGQGALGQEIEAIVDCLCDDRVNLHDTVEAIIDEIEGEE